MEIAQIIMLLTLILMITGRTPLYLTAIIGSVAASLAAGFPLTGKADVTISKLITSALSPVIVDMLGVLLFIGILEKCGYLDIIIRKIMEVGRKLGGGPGVATAGGVAAGVIGALTSFTQPAITAAVTGPASVKLGLDPNKAAATHGYAAQLSNLAGFTHPTFLAIIALTGVQFGMINLYGLIAGATIFIVNYYRAKKSMIAEGKPLHPPVGPGEEDYLDPTLVWKSFGSFAILVIGFCAGLPIFLVGVLASLVVIALTRTNLAEGEKAMISGVTKISTPLVAIISFLFMSAVINKIGLVTLVAKYLTPSLELAPVQLLFVVSALAGLITQSNAASAVIVLPFVQIILGMGVDPFATTVAAVGGAAIMQLYLTGGPVTSLPTIIPVIPGSDVKTANKFQRPSMLAGLVVSFLLTFIA